MSERAATLILREVGFISLAVATGGIEALAQDAAGNPWVIDLREDEFVFANYDAAREHFVLRANVGPVPPLQTEAILRFLLLYDSQSLDTGMRLALDEEDRSIKLIADVPVSAFGADALRFLLATIGTHLDAWRGILEDGEALGTETATPPAQDDTERAMIRP